MKVPKIVLIVIISSVAGLGAAAYLFPQFELEYVESTRKLEIDVVTYADMDGDGSDERISTNSTTQNIIALNLHSHTDAVWQENFYGVLANGGSVGVCDMDKDGYKEVAVPYVRNDSIFFGAVEFKTTERIIDEIFLSKLTRVGRVSEDFTVQVKAGDLDQDGADELIFVLQTGFGMYPRQVMVYYHKENKLYATPPEWEALLGSLVIRDLNHDGELEIVLTSYAPGNSNDTTIIYHDHNSYLMVFDKYLNKYDGEFSERCRACGTQYFENKDSTFFQFNTNENGAYQTFIYRLRFDGSRVNYGLIDKREGVYGFATKQLPALVTITNNDIDRSKVVGILDSEFSFEPKNIPVAPFFDLNSSAGKHYYIGTAGNTIILMNQRFAYQTIAVPDNLHATGNSKLTKIEDQYFLRIIYNQAEYSYKLREQPYWLQRIVFALTCSLFAGLFWAGSNYIIEARLRARQQQLMSLRVRALRNQLEPHFALNLMSSIKLHLLKNDVLAAEELFDLYTRILKYTLSGADEIGAKLSDEIKYVSTYLEIEQRQNDQLKSYQIDIEPLFENFVVPKMLIQEHVENALKHGIRKLKDESGEIKIEAMLINEKVEITIQDNGIGRGAVSIKSGKGIALTKELLEIFNSLTKKKVSQIVRDLPQGTKVTITANQ